MLYKEELWPRTGINFLNISSRCQILLVSNRSLSRVGIAWASYSQTIYLSNLDTLLLLSILGSFLLLFIKNRKRFIRISRCSSYSLLVLLFAETIPRAILSVWCVTTIIDGWEIVLNLIFKFKLFLLPSNGLVVFLNGCHSNANLKLLWLGNSRFLIVWDIQSLIFQTCWDILLFFNLISSPSMSRWHLSPTILTLSQIRVIPLSLWMLLLILDSFLTRLFFLLAISWSLLRDSC